MSEYITRMIEESDYFRTLNSHGSICWHGFPTQQRIKSAITPDFAVIITFIRRNRLKNRVYQQLKYICLSTFVRELSNLDQMLQTSFSILEQHTSIQSLIRIVRYLVCVFFCSFLFLFYGTLNILRCFSVFEELLLLLLKSLHSSLEYMHLCFFNMCVFAFSLVLQLLLMRINSSSSFFLLFPFCLLSLCLLLSSFILFHFIFYKFLFFIF